MNCKYSIKIPFESTYSYFLIALQIVKFFPYALRLHFCEHPRSNTTGLYSVKMFILFAKNKREAKTFVIKYHCLCYTMQERKKKLFGIVCVYFYFVSLNLK